VSATLIRGLAADLRPNRRPARVLFAGAVFWLASGLFHLGALAVDGWAWSGAVSFRKPISFSLSFFLLLATVGWVLDRLPDRPRLAGTIAWTLLVSSTAEVGLITLQAWRGRASHFNVFETGDAMIFTAMGIMVSIISLCLVAVLVWSLVKPPSDRLTRIAVIGGLLLLMTGLGIGQWIIQLGSDYVETRMAVPETVVYSERGVAKFPHAVALHGLQTFVLAAVMLRHGALAEASRRWILHLIVWSYTAAIVLASAQTVMGHAPLDPSVFSVGLAVSVVAIMAGFVRAGWALGRTVGTARPRSQELDVVR
jgi:hypothetical protein